jgi:NAD(P)-dependent dehydrogenase (short-subunit alcohol dehydrogenase family)
MQVQNAVDATVAQFGALHIAVASAGIVRTADFLEMSDADWDDVIAVNLKGVFLVRCRSEHMHVGRGGPQHSSLDVQAFIKQQ